MGKAVMFISFTLAKGVTEQEFLQVSEELNREFMSRQPGYISWQQLEDNGTWADLITWETMADAQNASKASMENEIAQRFCSMLDENSIKPNMFTVKKAY